MKKFKKILSIILSISLVGVNMSVIAAAPSDSPEELFPDSEMAQLEDIENYLAYTYMFNDAVDSLELDCGLTFEVRPYDFTQENFALNEEYLIDVQSFLNEFINDYDSQVPRTRTNGQLTDKQKAKANAMMYSMDRAKFSCRRTPSLNYSKETQYMFLSHYVDRNDYYWSTEDERLLLDGPRMSGERGYLADWLTNTDRLAYDIYMGHTGVNTSLQHLGNIAVDIGAFSGTVDDIVDGVDALTNAEYVLVLANGLILQDDAFTAYESLTEDMSGLFKLAAEYLSNDPTLKLSLLYDRFMEDEGLLSLYEEPDKSSVVRTTLSIVGAFIIGGPVGAGAAGLSAILGEALHFNITTYTNFFNYVAWVSMRYSFSARYADRTWYYIFGD